MERKEADILQGLIQQLQLFWDHCAPRPEKADYVCDTCGRGQWGFPEGNVGSSMCTMLLDPMSDSGERCKGVLRLVPKTSIF